MGKINSLLRVLPSVDEVMHEKIIEDFAPDIPREYLVEAVRKAIEEKRNTLMHGNEIDSDDIKNDILNSVFFYLEQASRTSLKRIINGAGIIIHTNIGRAVLSKNAVGNAVKAARGYTNLEFDLETGKRGKRMMHLKKYLAELTGAEDSLVVNNNAAAVMLVLDTYAKGREVIVSRGELIELGGSFRLPDVLKKSGAILKEVGCTNKTHLRDYEEAINENTAMILKTHMSNYAIQGFTKEVSGEELIKLGKKYNVMVVEDLGSGLMVDLSRYGLSGEATVRQVVDAGLDLVTMSGDKLLGGPQAGIIVGKTEYVSALAKNPLTRALRLDKMTIAALEGTLSLYKDYELMEKEIPFFQMLSLTKEEIRKRGENIINRVFDKTGRKSCFEIIPGGSRTGGGAFPVIDIPTWLIAIDLPGKTAEELRCDFLKTDPPVLTFRNQGKICIDLRTVFPDEDKFVEKAIIKVIE
ncbi:MAG: L-seryl-tRNA(Sec) selenium transferase [Vulcanimicrobiota bacterium]